MELKEQDKPELKKILPWVIDLTEEQKKKITRLNIGMQGQILLEYIDVDMNEFIDWYLDLYQGIAVGGGMVVDFLMWKKAQEKE